MYTLTNLGEMPRAGEMPVLVNVNGVPCWQSQSGRTFPLVCGAEDPPPAPKPEDPPKEGDGDEFDKDRAMATIKKLRDSEKAAREQLKELEALKAKSKEREDAEKTEVEKLTARVGELTAAHAEAESKTRRLQISQAIERAAQKLNARNPAVVAKLLDQTRLELDDSGEPTNAEQLVKDLLKDEPYLVAGKGENGSNSGVPPTPRSGVPAGHADRVNENREKLLATGDYQPL